MQIIYTNTHKFLVSWSTVLRKSPKCSKPRSSWCHQHVGPSQPLEAKRGRCWTAGSGDNSLCPGASKCVSVHGTKRCERAPAAAGESGLWSYCPGSPATEQHRNTALNSTLCTLLCYLFLCSWMMNDQRSVNVKLISIPGYCHSMIRQNNSPNNSEKGLVKSQSGDGFKSLNIPKKLNASSRNGRNMARKSKIAGQSGRKAKRQPLLKKTHNKYWLGMSQGMWET